MEPTMFTKTDESDYQLTRERAQKISYAKIKELMERNIAKASNNKRYTQYTKDMLKTFLLNPDKNLKNLREISRFLERHSMLYKKMIMYYATFYLYRYNIIQTEDFDKDEFEKTLKRMSKMNVWNIGYNSVYDCVRDGIYVGFVYDSGDNGIFMMPLDVDYVRVYGKTPEGQWLCYFDADYFSVGDNIEYIKTEVGGWDEVFKKGYENYVKNGAEYRWFRLPPERTFCMLAVDDSMFTTPVPFWLPLFKALLNLLDLEDIVQDKNELENYKLIVNKIPLLSGSNTVDDFAVSLEIVQQFERLLESVVPDLIGVAVLPGTDIDTVSFEESNNVKDADVINNSIENLFSNAGASRLVIASGSSSNSVGLKYSIINDASNVWFFTEQFESWLNYFMQKNVSKNSLLYIHKMNWYLEEDALKLDKDVSTLGLSTPLHFLSMKHKNPYIAYKQILFEQSLGLYDKLRPVESSYNTASSGQTGRPQSDDDSLSEEGIATRDGNKHEGTRANG